MKKITLLCMVFLTMTSLNLVAQGQDCANPIVINSLPYMTSDDTGNYGDDYENGSSPCSSYYMSGDDVVYTFTPGSNMNVNFTLSNIGSTYSGIHILDGCVDANPAPNCVGFAGNAGTSDRVVNADLVSGTTYYIIISTWATPQSTTYDLNIAAVTCPAPTAISVDPTAATTATVTWTAGGTETDWSYEYGPDGFTQGSGTTGTTTTNSLNLMGLTEGDDYDIYIQANCGASDDSDWTLGSWSQVVPPPNDNMAGAIPITPSAAGTGCASPGFTLTFASDGTTDSGMDGSCNTTDTGLDQFFTWTATTDALLWNDASPGNPGIIIRDAGGTEITCAQTFATDDTILSGWTIGDDLIIQIYDYAGSVSDVAFCLEEYSLPPAPNCASNPSPADGATDIPVGSTTLTWDAPSSGPAPTSYDLYSGVQSDGSDLSLVGNYTNPTADVTLNGFSTTIYWQIVPKNGPTGATGCPLWSLTTVAAPPIPSNDECANAEAVSVLPFNATLDAGSATNNGGFVGDCGFGMNDGVWYTFTTVDAGTIDITISAVNGWDAEVAIYSGSCGAFTCVDSADSGGTSGDETLTGVAVSAGTQYWINVGQFSGSTDNPEGAFTIDITTSDTTTLGLDSDSIEGFSLFPTVVQKELKIASQDVVESITLYNLMGQQVFTKKLNMTNTEVDLSTLAAGMYIVKAKVGNKVGTYKIIKE